MRRVVVTGMGCINSIAKDIEEFTNALRQGVSGIKPITIFDTENYRTNLAGQVSEEVYKELFCKADNLRIINFCFFACKEAIEMSRINDTVEKEKFGVSIATSLGCIDAIDDFHVKKNKGLEADYSCYLNTCSTLSQKIAEEYKLSGLIYTVSTACAAGTNSIGIAFDAIRYGRADAMICGGVDPVSRISINGFNTLKSLSASGIVKSFSKDRDGLIIGEGAGIVVLEEYEHAINRGATILCEVIGYGLSNDAYHMTTPDPKGGGACRAVLNCLKDAGLELSDVDYINAHGTGTNYNDLMELKAIQKIFGDYAKEIPITSIKGMVGHMLGAAGSIELISSIITIIEGFIPPTINFLEPIEGFEDYQFSPNKCANNQTKCVISNSFAFAGNTASIAIRKV